jgi:uncharacterized protein involved in propanediol utilization
MEQMAQLPAPAVPRTGVGWANGTFGELLQGVLAENDMDFLVTLPIAEGSRVTFEPATGGPDVSVHPPTKRKVSRLARLMIDRYRLPCGGRLRVDSDLAEGKGFASSSADLVATVHAIGDAFGLACDGPAVEDLLRDIEPSDGVMYPGVVAYYHRAVRLRKHLGYLDDLLIVGHDEGGEVDTIDFNRVPKPFDAADKAEYGRLLAELDEAVRWGDLAMIGRVASRSARLNEKLRPHRNVEWFEKLALEVEALGVVAAHSGTVLGILLDAADPDRTAKIRHARRALRPLPGSVSVHRTAATEDSAARTGPGDRGTDAEPRRHRRGEP